LKSLYQIFNLTVRDYSSVFIKPAKLHYFIKSLYQIINLTVRDHSNVFIKPAKLYYFNYATAR